MRMIFALVLLVGVALAGAAVYMTQGYINQTESALAKEREVRARTGALVEVYAVNKDMSYGDVLVKDDLKAVFVQENALPEGAFRDIEVLFPADKADLKRFVLRDLAKFEILLASRLTEPGQSVGVTGDLDKGMRAFAIRVDAADFLQPGDRVDIYWTGTVTSGSDSGEVTRLIGSAVKVIAVDRDGDGGLSAGDLTKRSITVSASPEQIAILAQAQATGQLVLSLVGLDDDTEVGTIEVDANALLGVTAAAPVIEALPEQVCTIRTRKGAEVVEIPVACRD
ncbi:MAG: Flp pilus assembly protein CpaB [Paracoccaceae bacterium]